MPAGRRYAPPGSRLADARPAHSRFDGAARTHNAKPFDFESEEGKRKLLKAADVVSQGMSSIRKREEERRLEREQRMATAVELKRRRVKGIAG